MFCDSDCSLKFEPSETTKSEKRIFPKVIDPKKGSGLGKQSKTSVYGTRVIPIGWLVLEKSPKARSSNWPIFTTYIGSEKFFPQF